MKTLQARLTKLADEGRKDSVVTFEQLGVDRLFVDEAHLFKNCFFHTKMRNVAGLSTTEAKKSTDLFMKCRFMDERTDGKGIIFASGTPISNSMSEMFTLQRYLQYDTLQRKGLGHFDSWASSFGDTVTSIELAPEGTGYRARTRFARFNNLPELMCMFKEVADIKTADTLNLKRPKVSGKIEEYTESNLNKFPDTETVEKFDTAEYQILIVAEKYQTGFDQPLLHTMYVDKKLAGIKAVQTLSRVNRSCKGKTETFILDFVNSRDDIEKAFQDYYKATGVAETTDPNVIYDIKNVLDSFMLYTDTEIDNFAKVFFKESKNQGNIDLAKLNGYIDPAVDRYTALTEEQDKMDFKGALAKFIRLYAFLTHIINLGDEKLHKFHAYAKCLLRKLPKDDTERTPDIGSDVMLQYYRVQKVSEGAIVLANEDGLLKSKTSGTGLPLEDEKEVLSAIIQSLNERLGTNFTEMDKVLEQFVQDMAGNQEMVLRSKNPLDLFKIIYENTIMDVVLGRMAKNQEFCEKYLEDEEFRREVDKILLPLVHERLSKI